MLNTDFKKAIDQLQGNPAAIASLALRALEVLSNGQSKVVDPSIPFVYGMETAVCLYCNSLDKSLGRLNYLYPENAAQWDHLYRHMSDYDYDGQFSAPGSAKIMFLLATDEIIQRAVDVGDGSGNRRLTISRNSQITPVDIPLTLLYPIDIVVTKAGGISVKYNLTKKNPLQNISTPDIEFEFRKQGKITYLYFEIPMLQLEVSSSVSAVTGTQGLKRSLSFKDKFYYLRAFMRNDEEDWQEMSVRHNPIVIDNAVPTVIARVKEGVVDIEIPQVYKNTNLLKDNVRIDVYTTKGEINVPIFNINNTLFKASWVDHDVREKELYSSQMSVFTNYIIASEGYITGGTNGQTFEQMRQRVVNRSNKTEGIAITPNQLETQLQDDGFATLLALDNITDRVFLATKQLTTPDMNTSSSMGALMMPHSITLNELTLNTDSTRNNQNQVTVLPNALYELVNGKLLLVEQQRLRNLLNQSITGIDNLINIVNDSRFYYCPYFMVHDVSKNIYNVKPYRLDRPRIISKSIEIENTLIGFSSSILSYKIQIDANYGGYSIYVQLSPSAELQDEPTENLSVQLRISDENNRYFYWFTGVLVTPLDPNSGKPLNDEYIYRFSLPTNWEITDNEEILIGPRKIPFKLDGYADIFTVVYKEGLSQALKTQMDDMIDVETLPGYTLMNSANYFAVVQEKVRIILGNELKHLWRRARTSIEETRFQKYTQEVYEVYEENEYAVDAFGAPEFTWVNNQLVYTVLHHKGEVKLDGDGNPRVKFVPGDTVVDEEGNPIPIGGDRGFMRQYDLMLLDGKYFFATHQPTVDYREAIKNEIDGWLGVIDNYSKELLERTSVYFHPKITEGDIKIMVDNNEQIYTPASQKLHIVYTVDERISSNESIVAAIRKTTAEKLVSFFESNLTISKSDIIAMLKEEMGEWVIGVKLNGWLLDKFETATVLDNSISFSVPKRLDVTSNLELIVVDEVRIEFVEHSMAAK